MHVRVLFVLLCCMMYVSHVCVCVTCVLVCVPLTCVCVLVCVCVCVCVWCACVRVCVVVCVCVCAHPCADGVVLLGVVRLGGGGDIGVGVLRDHGDPGGLRAVGVVVRVLLLSVAAGGLGGVLWRGTGESTGGSYGGVETGYIPTSAHRS